MPITHEIFLTLTKASVGLSNVDNTSDMNKPISTAVGIALAAKQDTLVSGTTLKTVNGNSLLGSGNVDVQATLVSGTNIKTINGVSLLGSGDITVGGGITIGSTAITSGTDNRVLFQASGKVSQSANFYYDGTSKLSLSASNGWASTKLFIDRISETYGQYIEWNGANTVGARIVNAGSGDNTALQLNSYNGSTNTALLAINGDIVIQNGKLTVGNHANGAKVDIKAQGALSTDLALRVRNSANAVNMFTIQGDGGWIFRNNANSSYFYHDAVNTWEQYGSSSKLTTIVGSFTTLKTDGTTGIGIGNSTHIAMLYKNGNFQIEENSGILQTSGQGGFSLKNNIPPSTNVSDRFVMYSNDIVSGNAAPHFRTEVGDIIKLYKQSAAGVSTVSDVVTVLTNLGFLA